MRKFFNLFLTFCIVASGSARGKAYWEAIAEMGQDAGDMSGLGRPHILVVDDSAPTRLWLNKVLGKQFDILGVPTLEKARYILSRHPFDAVLIDAALPDGCGLDFCRCLREDPPTRFLPILMVTASGDESFITEAFAAGCSDFIRKPIRPPELIARIDTALKLQTAMQRIEGLISELKERSERDPLTGLYNRHALYEHAHALLSTPPCSLGAVMVDIDNFKDCNDQRGHLAGDAALQSFTTRLCLHSPKDSIPARYGGDEFVILLPGYDDARTERRAQQLWKAMNASPSEDGLQCSMGYASLDRVPALRYTPEQQLQQLLSLCDEALYRSKAKGRNCVSGPQSSETGAY